MKPLDVKVSVEQPLGDNKGAVPNVQIDLVGVSDADLPRWEEQTRSVDSYFLASNPLRDSILRGVLNPGEDSPSKTFFSQDKLWDVWKKQNVMWLIILSDFPRSRPPGPGDARRLILPLDKARWGDRTGVELVLTRNGLINPDPPAPP